MTPYFAELNVSIKAEPLFQVFGINVTNSMLLGIAGYFLVLGWLLWVSHKATQNEAAGKKNGFFTRLALWCFTTLYRTCQEVIPNKRLCKIMAPFAISLFFYIGIQYYIELLPFVGESITVGGVPLFRGPVADLSFTFALAILAIILIQILATITHGLRGNLGRYFKNPFKGPIESFVGILELISEISRLVALSMRLFGNVFAGEILILIINWLTGYASPVLMPFVYIFEMFIGGIQAYVFFSLTIVFASIAVDTSEEKAGDSDKLTKDSDAKRIEPETAV